MLAAEPFDESAIPEILREKLTAKGDFLLLMFSPANKNFFNVKNVYQLSKEIKEMKKRVDNASTLPTKVYSFNGIECFRQTKVHELLILKKPLTM